MPRLSTFLFTCLCNLKKAMAESSGYSFLDDKNVGSELYNLRSPKKLKEMRMLKSNVDEVIYPSSYEMINGGSGAQNKFWDDKYTNKPSQAQDYQHLSGGLGQLTDGYKELNFDRKNNPDPFVAWLKTSPVDIGFFFEDEVTIDKIKISVDDFHRKKNKFCSPRQVIVDGVNYIFPKNPNGINQGPYEGTVELIGPIISSKVNILLYGRCSWIAISEIEFSHSIEKVEKIEKIMMKPIRYDMTNGGATMLNSIFVPFWDDSYEPSVPRASYDFLSGGTGQLTDGYKELKHSYHSKPGPFIGWRWSECCQPDITFFFGELTTIDEVRIAVDDSSDHVDDNACRPTEAIIGGMRYPFPKHESSILDKQGSGPYEAIISLQPAIIESQARITLISNCDWIFVSEVEFYAIDSDLDGVPDNIDECPGSIPDDPKNGAVGIHRFIWDGSSFITKNDSQTEQSEFYTIELTRGCTCEQILDIGECMGCREIGCTSYKLNEWIALGVSTNSNLSFMNNHTHHPPTTSTPTNILTNTPTNMPTKISMRHPTSIPSKTSSSNTKFPCAPWCAKNPTPWTAEPGTSQKCKWWNSCAGCVQCFPGSPTYSPTEKPERPCLNWCQNNPKPWGQKCSWIYSCAGCDDCD